MSIQFLISQRTERTSIPNSDPAVLEEEQITRQRTRLEVGLMSGRMHALAIVGLTALAGAYSYFTSQGEAPKLGEALDSIRAKFSKDQEAKKSSDTYRGSLTKGSHTGTGELSDAAFRPHLSAPIAGIGVDKTFFQNVARIFMPVQANFSRDHEFNGIATGQSPWAYARKFDNFDQITPGEAQKNAWRGVNSSMAEREHSTFSGVGFYSDKPEGGPGFFHKMQLDTPPINIKRVSFTGSASDEARVPESLGRIDAENQALALGRAKEFKRSWSVFIKENTDILEKAGVNADQMLAKVNEAQISVQEPLLSTSTINTLSELGKKMGFTGAPKEIAIGVIRSDHEGILKTGSSFLKNLSPEEIATMHNTIVTHLDANRSAGIQVTFDGTTSHTTGFPLVLVLLPRLRRHKGEKEIRNIKKLKPPTPEELRKKEVDASILEIEKVSNPKLDVLFSRNRPPLRNDIQLVHDSALIKELGTDYQKFTESAQTFRGSEYGKLKGTIHDETLIEEIAGHIVRGWMLVDYANLIANNRDKNAPLIEGLPDRANTLVDLEKYLAVLATRDPEVAKSINHSGNVIDVPQDDAHVEKQMNAAYFHAEALVVVAHAQTLNPSLSVPTLFKLFDEATNFRGDSGEAIAQQYNTLQNELLDLFEKRDEAVKTKDRNAVHEDIRKAKAKLQMFREWHSRPETPFKLNIPY